DSGAPLAGVYIVVGYKGLKLATITGADGRYTVNNVPAGKPADVFGFTGRGYRYHNSIYDDNLKIVLKPGETYTYDFKTFQLNDPAGEPQVANPTVSTDTVAAGQKVTFSLKASGGKGGLSDEVFAASPQLGRLALLVPAGGDTFSSSFTVPAGTPPGDYEFAFFAASNECYDNADFLKLTLHVT
ncbi:MAG: carboxypeptidase-like regulatory domain-containing protein, partial [Chloroflexota bacterium]|nr:carboxypeptidase-like regulatory domain-containing protein [Chloroflexota bacterium]